MVRVGSGAAFVAAMVFAAASARAGEMATEPDAPASAPADVAGAPATGGEEVRPPFPPPPAILPVPSAAPLAAPAVAPLREPGAAQVTHRYLYQRWPFWAVTGALVIGMIALTYAVTRPPPEPYFGSVGTIVAP